MKCGYCGVDFQAKRSTAKYCSARCRVYQARVSVTAELLSVTCKHKGCMREGAYHKGYCMEHWREAETGTL